MALDAILLSGIIAELRPKIIGARIDKVQQPERDKIVLSVRGGDPKTNNFKSTEFYEPVAFEQRVFKKAYYLFPIPQSETDKSPALVQNPGW